MEPVQPLRFAFCTIQNFSFNSGCAFADDEKSSTPLPIPPLIHRTNSSMQGRIMKRALLAALFLAIVTKPLLAEEWQTGTSQQPAGTPQLGTPIAFEPEQTPYRFWFNA